MEKVEFRITFHADLNFTEMPKEIADTLSEMLRKFPSSQNPGKHRIDVEEAKDGK